MKFNQRIGILGLDLLPLLLGFDGPPHPDNRRVQGEWAVGSEDLVATNLPQGTSTMYEMKLKMLGTKMAVAEHALTISAFFEITLHNGITEVSAAGSYTDDRCDAYAYA